MIERPPTDIVKYRQAVVPLLERLPGSEWGNFWLLLKVLFPFDPPEDDRFRYVRYLSDTLEALKEEGVAEQRGHLGWRLIRD